MALTKTNIKHIDLVLHHSQDNINGVLLMVILFCKFNNETSKLSIPVNWDTSQIIKIQSKLKIYYEKDSIKYIINAIIGCTT